MGNQLKINEKVRNCASNHNDIFLHRIVIEHALVSAFDLSFSLRPHAYFHPLIGFWFDFVQLDDDVPTTGES